MKTAINSVYSWVLMGLFFFCLVAPEKSHAGENTSEVWNLPVPRLVFEQTPLDEALSIIEKRSRLLDSEHNGVHIVYSFSNDHPQPEITLTTSEWTIREVLTQVLVIASLKPVIISNVALIVRVQPRYIQTALHGYCRNVVNNEPITEFSIKQAVPGLRPVLACKADGYFVCALFCEIELLVLGDGLVIWSAPNHGLQEIRISAPGYKDHVITNSIYGEGKTGERYIDIELAPLDKGQTGGKGANQPLK